MHMSLYLSCNQGGHWCGGERRTILLENDFDECLKLKFRPYIYFSVMIYKQICMNSSFLFVGKIYLF